jgi:hypothetical protein
MSTSCRDTFKPGGQRKSRYHGARLKRLLAMLDNTALKDLLGNKW